MTDLSAVSVTTYTTNNSTCNSTTPKPRGSHCCQGEGILCKWNPTAGFPLKSFDHCLWRADRAINSSRFNSGCPTPDLGLRAGLLNCGVRGVVRQNKAVVRWEGEVRGVRRIGVVGCCELGVGVVLPLVMTRLRVVLVFSSLCSLHLSYKCCFALRLAFVLSLAPVSGFLDVKAIVPWLFDSVCCYLTVFVYCVCHQK